jgi:muramoyltetrapeptide carboxypeptidase LdcA involved in peptidoglycan recycling
MIEDLALKFMIKPKKLKPGDKVAAISLSWGGAGKYPHRYEAGKTQFEKEFGVTVVETKNALRNPEWLARNPEARADDLMEAFSDKSINGIISTIGGDDSIRVLPFVDLEIIRETPKVFMGYSDTTITHAVCWKVGLVSFYGPAFLSGFAENGGMFPYMVDSVRRTLFSSEPIGQIEPNRDGWTVEHVAWADPGNQLRKRKLNTCTGWVFHQNSGHVEGKLFGGSLEVLNFLRGTSFWPEKKDLDGAILFLETSEEAPPPSAVVRFVRSMAAMGILEHLSGILLGRPGGQLKPDQYPEYGEQLCNTVREEYGLTDLPIISGIDFGHTDPMVVIPEGLMARIDSEKKKFEILESGVID